MLGCVFKSHCDFYIFYVELNLMIMERFTMKKFPFYATIIYFALVLGSFAQAKQTFTITQGKPEINHVDVGTTGMSVGDSYVFEAPFTTKDGKMGRIYGVNTIISIPAGSNDPFIDRMSLIVLDFGKSDTLIVSGKAVHGTYQSEIKDNEPNLRAVIGGTGRFIGARGQMSITRNPAGSYEHEIQLLD